MINVSSDLKVEKDKNLDENLKLENLKDNYKIVKEIKAEIIPTLKKITKFFVWIFFIIFILSLSLIVVIAGATITVFILHRIASSDYRWLNDMDLKNLENMVTGGSFTIIIVVTLGKIKDFFFKK